MTENINIDNFDIYRYNTIANIKKNIKLKRMNMENNLDDKGGFLWGLLGADPVSVERMIQYLGG